MGTTSVGIIIFICLSCWVNQCSAAAYGEACDTNNPCKPNSYQECSNATCVCTVGYLENTTQNGCNAGLGYTCTAEVTCHDSSAECVSGTSTSTCTCESTYFDDNGSTVGGTCIQKINPGDECPDPNATGVTGTCDDTNSECSSDVSSSTTYRCQCLSQYTLQNGSCVEYLKRFVRGTNGSSNDTSDCSTDNDCSNSGTCTNGACDCKAGYTGDTCETAIKLGESCLSKNDCNNIANADCIGNVCTCTDGYYDTQPDPGGSCQKRTLDQTCSANTQCSVPNSECSSVTCSCKNDYFRDGGACLKRNLGETCSSTSQCNDTNAKCEVTCQCNDGFYDSDGQSIGGQCLAKKDNGFPCTTTVECATTNAVCSSTTRKCSCMSGYYQVNVKTCSKRNLGETCTNKNQCNDVNAKCDNRCQCNDNFYDSNGQCFPKRNLGDTCNYQNQCNDANTKCDVTCQCNDNFYDSNGQSSGGQCLAKKINGASCTDTRECKTSNTVCSIGKCTCLSDYYEVDVNTCSKRSLGQTCGADSHCSEVANSVCSGGTCSCKHDFFKVGAACLKRYLDQRCGADSHCSEVANSECSSGTNICSCKNDFFRVGKACLKRQLGESCGLSSQCSALNSMCNSSCQCLSTHYDSNGAQSSGSCILKVSLGQTCPMPTFHVPDTATCRDSNARCTQSGSSAYTCRCTSSYYDSMDINNRKCTRKVGLGSHCPRSDACSTANAGCVGGKCLCDSDFYDDNGENSGGYCLNRKPLDGICTGSPPVNIDQCIDSRAECISSGSSHKCTCIRGYHPENSQCAANKPLGEHCANVTECSDPAAGCLDGKCTCDNNHYDDNGLQAKGVCHPMTNLQVADIDFPSVKTNEIVVTWLTPITYIQRIDGFTVEWKGTNDNTLAVESQDVDSSTESLTLTKGIVPGKAYNVTVTSRNDNTQQNSVRTTSKTKQQAAKPDIPRSLTTPDIDAEDQEITIGWSAPVNGVVSGYKVILIDGVNEIFNEPSTPSLTFRSTNTFEIKNGYRYNVSITSKSQVFEGNNYVPSDLYEEEIKTLVQVPKTPRDVQVVDIEAKTFTVTWHIDGRSPGETNFTVSLTADSPARNITITKNGFDVRTHTFENLEEYWNYSVVVSAATEKGVQQSDRTAKYRTHSAAPGKVSDLTLIPHPDGNYTRMKITWKAPPILQQNSVIKDYSFSYLSVEDTITKGLEKLEHISSESHKYEKVVDVVPESTYEFKVFATNQKNMTGDQTMKKEEAPAGVPPNIEDTGVTVINKDEVSNIGQTSFTVPLAVEFFEVETYGVIRATGLIACKKACEGLDVMSLSDFKSMTNWKTFSQGNMNNYRVTPEDWQNELEEKNAGNSRRKRSTVKEYTIGSGKCTSDDESSFCNAPLQPGTSYVIKAVSCTNGGCLLSNDYGPIATKVVPDVPDNTPMIIGIVVAVVVLVGIGAVVGFILIRKRRGPGKMKPASDSDDDDFTTIDPAISKIKRKRPFLLSDIEDYVNNMHKDSNLLFSSEYEDLKTLSPKHPCDAADREENRMRNRYINIIPFDHTRVKLSTNGEDDPCDYINANYLPGYTSPREYIGCQGPIPGTIDDFWRMTWEQNVSVIVMLTLCKEGQKIKCEQYWPEDVAEPKQYGDVIVEMTSYSNIRTYDYRLFKITNGSQTRVIKHFHFLSWLDFQANVHHDIILDFILQVRQHVQPPDTSGPMIVHCSAGVGRTGTYIALDHLMQFINEHDFDVQVDIFDMVLNLRENRQHMVQTEQQYVFIHDCVKEILERKRRNMENIYENEAFSQDENIYQNEQQNLYANVAASGHEQNTEL